MADTLTNTELMAENARLKAALAPFAKVAERFQPEGRALADKRHLQTILWSTADRRYEISVTDCMAAHEALQEAKPLLAAAWMASLNTPGSTIRLYGRTWQAALVRAAEAGWPAENTQIIPLYSLGRRGAPEDTQEDSRRLDARPEG